VSKSILEGFNRTKKQFQLTKLTYIVISLFLSFSVFPKISQGALLSETNRVIGNWSLSAYSRDSEPYDFSHCSAFVTYGAGDLMLFLNSGANDSLWMGVAHKSIAKDANGSTVTLQADAKPKLIGKATVPQDGLTLINFPSQSALRRTLFDSKSIFVTFSNGWAESFNLANANSVLEALRKCGNLEPPFSDLVSSALAVRDSRAEKIGLAESSSDKSAGSQNDLKSSTEDDAQWQKSRDAYNRRDYQMVLKILRPLAARGHAKSQNSLAWMYSNGFGVPQSYAEALKWYRLSAEQGNATSQSNLGLMYQEGRGVPQSDAEAIKWYRLSAEQGDAQGQNNLGSMYQEGRGVPQSDAEALKWFRLSAAQGNAQAQANLGWHYRNGRGVTESEAEAVKWFRLSAEQGNEYSQNQLRQMGIDLSRSQIAKKETEPKSLGLSASSDSERVKILEQRLARLEAQTQQAERKALSDTRPPEVRILGKYSQDTTGVIEGVVTDNTGVAELSINDRLVSFDKSGRFKYKEYLPSGGKEFTIVAIDQVGLKSTESVRLNRDVPKQVAKLSFDSLNPTTRQAKSNGNAIALVVGVANYENTAVAEYADKDAQVFYDYANLKLGIPRDRIQNLINDKADVVGLLSGINKWLKRSVKQGESDVYIFFAGHGLASDDGDTAYLIPYDGAPDFLERTAISRDEVFREVSSVNPRSVTVFLDTCYSGDTRGETRLIAGRPLSIKLQEQSLPKGFTVLTAAGGDQIAKPLKEAQHGLFSYFLMKGMEGGADSNSDNEITARELHTYVRENVVQQSGGSQVPELQGDGERVLVRFR
jgi:TPR repeat protein